ncbi:MBL fold metallo-hydrolase [Pollutibacter soli]|uniref:MBL fold metallo-hydrolase n=1 Tax=Pollutibacter soli TaxID=3034157 RepID=UPI0030140D93
MFIQQLYTTCLSEAAYYIESEGEAALIDPLRDTESYLELAAARNAEIKFIFETHFHADFVSGHLDLHEKTGAPIVYGPETRTSFPVRIAKDGEIFKIGKISLEVLHTPGHTVESSCYLLRDENGKPQAVFTGDTLFVGDVGRPDLSSGEKTSEELAVMLYHSLENKIKNLPDDVIVYPAHGAGSSCGKNIGSEKATTIGVEKQSNYALLATDEASFVKAVTEGLQAPPDYFFINARINKEGYDSLEKILHKSLVAISAGELKKRIELDETTVILDTRNQQEFSDGFVPGSIFIGLNGRFAEWAGSILPFDQEIILVTDPGKEKETIVRLARVGFDRVAGYLDGGYEAWKKAGFDSDLLINVEADELAMDLPFDDHLVLVDVRKEAEFDDGHVKDALNMPLDTLKDPGTIAELNETDNLYLYCGSGFRSVVAASLLKRQGYHSLRNVLGGWNAIREEKAIPQAKESQALN